MGANKGYSNRAKSGDKASIARRDQRAAQAQMEKARGKRTKLKRKGDMGKRKG
jgi:hypothetical protein